MNRAITPLLLAITLGLPATGQATPMQRAVTLPLAAASPETLLVEVKSDKKGKAKGARKAAKKQAKAAKKAAKQAAKAAKKAGKPAGKAKSNGKAKADLPKVKIDAGVRDLAEQVAGDLQKGRIDSGTLAALAAPLAALGTAGLAEVLIDCPPGLARQAVPCVPPGQADRTVTAEDWRARDEDELRQVLSESQNSIDRDFEAQQVELASVEDLDATEDATAYDDAVRDETLPAPETGGESREINERILRLTQAEIIRLFDLDPAPEGSKYVVIDGRPVLLDEENYLRIRALRHLDEVDVFEVEVEDLTAVRGHTEWLEIYDLQAPDADRYYAMVDGELLLVPVKAYELLQLLRVVALAPSRDVAQAE